MISPSAVLSVDLVCAALRSESAPTDSSPAALALAQERYIRFLLLIAKNPDRSVAPTRDIDAMWHLHMQHPKRYAADCIRLFGDLLDHDGGFGADTSEVPELQRVFSDTAAMWAAEYGEPYAEDDTSMVKCTRNCVSRCRHACKS